MLAKFILFAIIIKASGETPNCVFGPLAQLAEHVTFNHGVPGSNLGWITTPTTTNKFVLI